MTTKCTTVDQATIALNREKELRTALRGQRKSAAADVATADELVQRLSAELLDASLLLQPLQVSDDAVIPDSIQQAVGPLCAALKGTVIPALPTSAAGVDDL